MTPDEAHTEQARRDISAARAELRGRRDQVVAECDDRLNLLDNLGASLDNGDLTPNVVQNRVRQLLGDRGNLRRGARAGRTSIGMQVPQTAATTAAVTVRTGPAKAQVASNLERARTAVDNRVAHIVLGGRTNEGRLELALLRSLRRAVEQQASSLPGDVVLLDSVMEYADQAAATVHDLERGGSGRLRRLLEYDRELASQLIALGGSGATIKDKLKRARALLDAGDPDLEASLQAAVSIFTHLQQELQRRLRGEQESFLDELVAGPRPN